VKRDKALPFQACRKAGVFKLLELLFRLHQRYYPKLSEITIPPGFSFVYLCLRLEAAMRNSNNQVKRNPPKWVSQSKLILNPADLFLYR